ncbi:histidine phosphatase family protein [Pelagibius sp. 7325]|uniref:histidine phosphatase family protein n=1 Tax=Pelagibius sp. 7325 TaxID=3131994 RepID=UPI0030EEDCAC
MAGLLAATPALAGDFDLSKLNDGGIVLLLRHVKAGGVDSDDFDLKDCRTQREVGGPGRAQAAVLAQRFKVAGISAARVLTSQWCRARQTAELLGLGPVTDEPALNYYHWKLGSEAAMTEALKRFFIDLKAPTPGAPLVLVSHTTAFGLIGVDAPQSGGGLVLRPNGTATPEVVGVISAPE